MTLPLKDVLCVSSLSPGVYARGKMVIAQRLFHRLDTRKGQLRGSPGELNFGIKLSDEIGRAVSESQQNALPDMIRGELLKDNAVQDVTVLLTKTETNGAVYYSIQVDVQSTDGPFALNILASAVSIQLLGVA